jgi:hypothetical protein
MPDRHAVSIRGHAELHTANPPASAAMGVVRPATLCAQSRAIGARTRALPTQLRPRSYSAGEPEFQIPRCCVSRRAGWAGFGFAEGVQFGGNFASLGHPGPMVDLPRFSQVCFRVGCTAGGEGAAA